MKLYLKMFSLILVISVIVGMFCACENNEDNINKLTASLKYVEENINNHYCAVDNSDFVIEEIETNEDSVVMMRIFPVFSMDEKLNNYFNKINHLTQTVENIKRNNISLIEIRECILNNISKIREIVNLIKNGEYELTEQQINLANEANLSMKNYSDLIASHSQIINNQIKDIKKNNSLLNNVDTLNLRYNNLLNQIVMQNTNAGNLCSVLNTLAAHLGKNFVTASSYTEKTPIKRIYLKDAPKKNKHYIDKDLFKQTCF